MGGPAIGQLVYSDCVRLSMVLRPVDDGRMNGAPGEGDDANHEYDGRDAVLPGEGYVFHTYGDERFLRSVVASVKSLRRYDRRRPVALYAPTEHLQTLRRMGLEAEFAVTRGLPDEHRSITGFKLHLERFQPFERNLYLDADMIWCRNPDPLWLQLSAYTFTATGMERADPFFGGPKGWSVLVDIFLDRRRKTMRRFGLKHLPRVQAGMIYTQDPALVSDVCARAREFLARRGETHFRSRLDEGRTEESCEWSLAMAMSSLQLPVYPWFQNYNSPQLDYITGLTRHDRDFTEVECRYYCDELVYSVRGVRTLAIRDRLFRIMSRLPGRGDHMDVTPFVLHFGWNHEKAVFVDFAERVWAQVADAAKAREREVADVESPL